MREMREREAALPVAKSPEREITREARSDENENERPPVCSCALDVRAVATKAIAICYFGCSLPFTFT